MRILLVEDEARMAQTIKRGPREAAYVVDVARDGEDALYQASINDYDAVILDVMIPKRDGSISAQTMPWERWLMPSQRRSERISATPFSMQRVLVAAERGTTAQTRR
jgi:DNA-binding response OmpR family regulator